MFNSHCNNNDQKRQIAPKKKNLEKVCVPRDSNPGYIDSKTTVVSTTLWRPRALIDKNNQYMLKL